MGFPASSSPGEDPRDPDNVSLERVRALLDTLERGVILADWDGRVLTMNERARNCLGNFGLNGHTPLNILEDLLQVEPREILRRIQGGQSEIALSGIFAGKPYHARLRWIRESEWLA